MGDFFFLIESLAPGLYIFGAFFLAWNFMQFLGARYHLRTAQFMLERELAERRGGHAVTRFLFTAQLLVAVWGISTQAAPTWRNEMPESSDTNTLANFQTSTPSLGAAFETPVPAAGDSNDPIIPQTAPPPSTPQGTIGPGRDRVGCIRGQAWIESPANKQVIFEAIPVRGTAAVDNFAFYRFEIKADQIGENFAPLGDYDQPVVDGNGVLGQFLPYDFLPGAYRFRIVVFDTGNIARASCEISINISPPIPTQTPIGQ